MLVDTLVKQGTRLKGQDISLHRCSQYVFSRISTSSIYIAVNSPSFVTLCGDEQKGKEKQK